ARGEEAPRDDHPRAASALGRRGRAARQDARRRADAPLLRAAPPPRPPLGSASKTSVASPARPKRVREAQAETAEAGSHPVAARWRSSSPDAARGSPGAAGGLLKQGLGQRPAGPGGGSVSQTKSTYPIIISCHVCSPQRTSVLGSGL